MVLRLNRKQLGELIEDIEAKGNDATALRQELAELGPEEKPGPSRRGLRSEDREETSEERLIRRMGDRFPGGTPPFKEYPRSFINSSKSNFPAKRYFFIATLNCRRLPPYRA